MLEFQQFNIIWDRKMTEYEKHAAELVEAPRDGVRCACVCVCVCVVCLGGGTRARNDWR